MNHAINNLLTALNSIGEAFCEYAADVFVQSALLVFVIFIIDLLLRKRVRAIFRYCLWLLVLVKLILPPTLSLPTGIGYWAADQLPAVSSGAFEVVGLEGIGASAGMPHVASSEDPVDNVPSATPAASRPAPITWQAVLFVLWLVGVLAFLIVLAQRLKFVRGLVAAGHPAEAETLGLLQQCRRQLGVRRDTKLRLSETLQSPAVCGLLETTILIPTNLAEKLSPEGLRGTLIHELAHIKRGDLWVNAVQTFLQIIYFYNPFVWFANSVIRKVCEEAVDETVLVALGGKARDYSNTLINIGEMVFWKADLGLRLIGVAESRKALQWRIRHMLTRPIPKSSKLGVLGIAALLVVAATLLPMARAERSDQSNAPVAATNEGNAVQSLYQAAADGDIEQVRQLISEGADVNARGIRGKTPLLGAVRAGHLGVVKVLLDKGAKVDFGGGKYTPLFHPIWDANIDTEMVKILIASGADVNVHPEGGNDTPLLYAVFYRRPDIAKLLIDAGADVNAEIEDGLTPLHIALLRAYPKVAQQFVGTGVKIPAFHNAVLAGDLAKVKQLVESGTDVDTPDEFGWTPACWAVSAGRNEVAEYLLSQGADITVKMGRGLTLLHQASTSGLVDIVKSLIAKGAEVDVKCEAGGTPLKYAAASGQTAAVKLLIANGAAINFTAKDGTHPLGDAALYGHEDVVKLLLANGADVNMGAKARGTALNAAAVGGNSKIIDILIAHGVDVNAVSENGTALSLTASSLDSRTTASDNRRAKIAQKLLAHGADVDVKHPRSGVTPLHGAVVLGRYRTAEVLIAAGADVNSTNNEGKTLLALARKQGRTKIVELLRKHGAK